MDGAVADGALAPGLLAQREVVQDARPAEDVPAASDLGSGGGV